MRGQLALAVFNARVHAKEEGDLTRRDRALEELRRLAADHPEDAMNPPPLPPLACDHSRCEPAIGIFRR